MKPRLLDAFCCEGGATYGYQTAGFHVTGIDLDARPDYIGDAFIQGDAVAYIREHGHEYDAIHASPPCFPAQTPVLTARGVIGIEEVQIGDLVLTHEGRWRSVSATMSRRARVIADKWLAATEDHPFWTRQKLGKGVYSEPAWTPAAEMEGQFVAIPSQADPLPVPPVSPSVDMSASSLWYMVGRWLGDGWTRRVQVDPKPHRPHGGLFTEQQECPACGAPSARSGRWTHLWNAYCSRRCSNVLGRRMRRVSRADVFICCAREEADDLAALLARTGFSWGRSEERTATRFVASSRELCDWLIAHFGRYAYGKTLPGWAFGMPEDARRALLEGYLAADGYRIREGQGANTVSGNLAIGMRLLAAGLGYSTSLTLAKANRDAVIEGRAVNERPLWRLSLNASNRYGHSTEKHWWCKRRKGLELRGVETVYDITVDEDHSFVAWGFVVHNCQRFSTATPGHRREEWPDLIAPTREALIASGRPWVLENVEGARRHLDHAIRLCGSSFGLKVRRHRWFESNVLLMPLACEHARQGIPVGVYGQHGDLQGGVGRPGGTSRGIKARDLAEAREAMGMPWATWRGCVEAIPPAYADWLGGQLIEHVKEQAA